MATNTTQIKEGVDKKLEDIVRENKLWAAEVARKSGLPGGRNGPQDALRHMIGTAGLAVRFGETAVFLGTLYNESKVYKENIDGGMSKEQAQAQEEYDMDVGNNLRVIQSSLRHKGKFELVLRDIFEMVGNGPAKPDRGKSESGPNKGQNAAVWKSSPANDTFDRTQTTRSAQDALRENPGPLKVYVGSVEVEEDGNKTKFPVTSDEEITHPQGERDDTPTSARELHEMMIALGVEPPISAAELEVLLSDLPDEFKTELLRTKANSPTHFTAIQILIASSDTNGELKERLTRFLKKHFGPGAEPGLQEPEITDPPKPLKESDLTKIIDLDSTKVVKP